MDWEGWSNGLNLLYQALESATLTHWLVGDLSKWLGGSCVEGEEAYPLPRGRIKERVTTPIPPFPLIKGEGARSVYRAGPQ